ncbi:MAG: hypothetical protein COA44_12800 [Arcobacter sp.]|nr:MAG: hypothetical protein COA44_12800 [Arcobacter sp.]
MKENQKITTYPNSKNTKTETYQDGDAFITRHFYNGKNAYVKEFITVKDGIKTVKHNTEKGVMSKLEHFVDELRQGIETRYFVSKADGSAKSTKTYDQGKLHGENITYNEMGKIIKHEVFATGKLVLKYFGEDNDNGEITNVEIIDEDNVKNLPVDEYEKLQTLRS